MDFKEALDAAAQAAFDEETAEFTAGERKKWSVYAPYEELEDDNGNPTGVIRFFFKQNATIKMKDGSTKPVQVFIVDSQGNDIVGKPVFNGAVIRVMYKLRNIKMTSNKQAGVRLDFSGVQVKEMRAGGRPKFGSIEGGYVDSGDTSDTDGSSGDAQSGDY